jgi:hypothetical protein
MKNYLLELESKKFIKTLFSSADISTFLRIFNKKVFLDFEMAACAPEYNDFLLLKKEKKTVGIVQICLRCHMHTIEGKTLKNQKVCFAGSIEGSELETLLKKYKTR